MAPTIPCASGHEIREGGARRHRSGGAIGKTGVGRTEKRGKQGKKVARREVGKYVSQSRKLRITANQQAKVRAQGLCLLPLLAVGPQSRKVYKSFRESKDQNGVGMDQTGVGNDHRSGGNLLTIYRSRGNTE